MGRNPVVLLGAVAALALLALWMVLGTPGQIVSDDAPRAVLDTPPQRDVTQVEVRPGDSAAEIGRALQDAVVITSARRFETLVSLQGYADVLAAGVYDFEPGLLTLEIVERIRDGITSPQVVTIPEGLRLEEIAARLEAAGIVTSAAFLAAALDPASVSGTLAAQRPPGTSVEGYLFPSTYRFSLLVSAQGAVRVMAQRMDAQLTPDRLAAARDAGRTLHTVLTVASIVEREAVIPAEQPVIASVFWNRVDAGMRLEADPTVQYAVAEQPGNVAQFGYWKTGLTLDDLMLDSTYNTYQIAGPPPTPIAAPGLGAIDAAMAPATTDFLFFVARGDGSHAFARTLEEHQENVERFQGGGE